MIATKAEILMTLEILQRRSLCISKTFSDKLEAIYLTPIGKDIMSNLIEEDINNLMQAKQRFDVFENMKKNYK